jgi:PREDICTED: similar to CG4165-PA
MLIAYPPPILTLHIKRFEVDARHITLKKINQFISFPLKLNLSPFTSRIYLPLSKLFEDHLSDPPNNTMIYDLYAVVEHSGSIRSGHYTAYIKLRKAGKSLQKFIRLSPFVTSIEEIVESIDYNNFNDFDHTFNGEEESKEEGKWFYISDSQVAASDVFSVLHSQAYLLFYERIE